ncbi:MAG: hypothetical protein JWQ71_1534 [Pedosphaera sp.]|nr:hypothetical protein [Pedosphaera sp.]
MTLLNWLMAYSRDIRRRLAGMVFLTIAAGMLIVGQTVLKPHLQQANFIFYWMVCFLFTGLTLVVALLDLRSIRRRSQDEQKRLIKSTLLDVVEDENGGVSADENNK